MLKIYSYLYKSVMLLLMSAFTLTASAQADRKFIRNGNRLYRQQQFAKAEAEYRKALSANSRNTQASYNLGCALLQQQKDSAAKTMRVEPKRLLPLLIRKVSTCLCLVLATLRVHLSQWLMVDI